MRQTKLNIRGFSLIELMIAMVVGLIVLAGVFSIFGQTLRNNRSQLSSARLNQDIGTVSTLMANDIRRAGFSASSLQVYGGGTPAGWFNARNADVNIVQYNGTPSCILYSYNLDLDNPDLDGNGTVDATDKAANDAGNTVIDPNERFGFRLNTTDSTIEMRQSCDPTDSGDATNPANACYTDCTAGSWQPITDPNVVQVTELSFSSVGSKCRDRNDRHYWATVGALDTAADRAAAPTQFPCDATTDSGLAIMYYDKTTRTYGATPPAGISGFADIALLTPTDPGFAAQDPADPTTFWDSSVETRQVNIYISSRLTSDSAVTKEASTSIKLGNPRVFVAPTP